MNFEVVKLHKGQRLAKTERRKQRQNHWTPPKLISKSSVMNTYSRLQSKFGYDYESDNRQMRWMKDQFKDKMVKYLGGRDWVPKLSHKQKGQIKDNLNFYPQEHLLIRVFRTAEAKAELGLLFDGFNRLKK